VCFCVLSLNFLCYSQAITLLVSMSCSPSPSPSFPHTRKHIAHTTTHIAHRRRSHGSLLCVRNLRILCMLAGSSNSTLRRQGLTTSLRVICTALTQPRCAAHCEQSTFPFIYPSSLPPSYSSPPIHTSLPPCLSSLQLHEVVVIETCWLHSIDAEYANQ
jgi:hypothetical protein